MTSEQNIDQIYVIGGDKTNHTIYKIHQASQECSLDIALAGIPKTIDNAIDNDVDYID
jgi:6-phosphofructokinase